MAVEEEPLIGAVRDALDGDHPIEFLWLVSTLILATTPLPVAPESGEKPPTLDELVDSFIGVQGRESTAILAGLGAMCSDDGAVALRCRKVAEARRDRLPAWLADLGRTAVHRVVCKTHVLGGDEEVLLGIRFADGQEMTCVVAVDSSTHAISDAFFVPDSVGAVLSVATAANTDPGTAFDDVPPGRARADLQKALDRPLSMVSSQESDTWPGSRALVAWLVRLMADDRADSPAR
ncbi:hypothetical protein [Mycolicibacterium vaccae]|uniref:hypothetical protein n=1 Tax=Mycolicibacterium vaccae TaxID=1810 RepID=UPI003D002129